MPTNIRGSIYRPMVTIDDDGCTVCPEVLTPLTVSPLVISNGDTLDSITGNCQDIDGAVTTTFHYSYESLDIPITDESLLLPLDTSTVFVNNSASEIKVNVFMRCEDADGCVVWDKAIVKVYPVSTFALRRGDCDTITGSFSPVYTPSGIAPSYVPVVGDVFYTDQSFTNVFIGEVGKTYQLSNDIPFANNITNNIYEINNLGVITSITVCP